MGLWKSPMATTSAWTGRRGCSRKTLCVSTWLPLWYEGSLSRFEKPLTKERVRERQGKELMSLFSSLQVSASGLAAQRTRAELLVENMANSETTRTAEGGPYKRKDAVFSTELQSSPFSAVFQSEVSTGVTVADILTD